MLELSDPNAPTRVSGFWKRNLEDYARRTGLRLPSLRGLRPYAGKAVRRWTDGRVGGRPITWPGMNEDVATAPMLDVPGGVAKRFEVIRRQIRRDRVNKESATFVLNPGHSGLDYAQGPRFKVDTPSGVRGAMRDRRHPRETQYYDQEVAPFTTSRGLIRERQLTAPADFSIANSETPRDKAGATDIAKAQRYALGTASVPAVVRADVSTPASSFLPLAAVLAVFWLVFRGRG